MVLPSTPGLNTDDLEDAAESVGINLLHGFSSPLSFDPPKSTPSPLPDTTSEEEKRREELRHMREAELQQPLISTLTTATYVGRNLGLCVNYTDTQSCNAEMQAMEARRRDRKGVLRISLNAQTLSLDSGRCASAVRCVGGNSRGSSTTGGSRTNINDITTSVNSKDLHDMGFLGKIREENPVEYWATVADLIVEVGQDAGRMGLDMVILQGDYVLERDFLEMLETALEFLDGGVEIIEDLRKDGGGIGYEPVFLAARGAAEMAKRVQVGQKWYEEDAECMKD